MSTSILDLIPDKISIPVGKGSLLVRGLVLDEIIALIKEHGEVLKPFLSKQPAIEGAIDNSLENLLLEAPKVVYQIIQFGAEIPDEESEAIPRFPLVSQLELLQSIWSETIPDIKKFSGLLKSMVQGLKLA